MSVTMEWLLEESDLKGLRCVVGEDLKEKEIEGVSVLDNPNAIHWVKEGELVVTSGYLLRKQPEICESIVRDLARAGCVGLGVKMKSYMLEFPKKMIQAAEEENLLLFDIPFYYSLSDLSRTVYNQLYKQEEDKRTTERKLIDDLTDIFFSKRGVMEMVYRIAGHMNRTVLLLDEEFRCMYAAKRMSQKDLCSKGDLLKRSKITDDHHDVFRFKDRREVNVYNLLLSGEKVNATLLVVEDEKPLSEDEIALLVRCGNIVTMGLEYSWQKSVDRYLYDNIHYKELYEYVAGLRNYEGESLSELLRLVNFKPQSKRVLLLAEIGADTMQTDGILRSLEQQVSSMRETKGMERIIFSYNQKYLIYLFQPENISALSFEYSAKKLAKKIRENLCLTMPNVDIRIGISRVSQDLEGIARSYREAEKALDIGGQLKLENEILIYNDLSIYDYFIQYPKCEVTSFYSHFAELQKYDEEYHTDLTVTLLTFIELKFNMSDTARALYIHRNTLIKRMMKIKELLNCDLDSMDELFPFCVEAAAYRLFNKEERR